MISGERHHRTPRWSSKTKWLVVAAGTTALLLILAANRSTLAKFAARSLGLSLDLGYTAHYVLPDGYRGIFTVRENPTRGTPPEIRDHGEFVYRIPASGHLETSDITPMLTTHKRMASYQSGTPIGNEGDPAEINLRGVTGISSDGKMRDLIGTEAELNHWWSDRVDWFRIESSGAEKRDAERSE